MKVASVVGLPLRRSERDLSLGELRLLWWRPALAVVFAALAVMVRLTPPGPGATPRIELVTMAAFLAAALLRNRIAWLLPLIGVAISDLLLGNSIILVFTWSAWAMVGFLALAIRHTPSGWSRVWAAVVYALASQTLFFAWVNFGMWVLGPWEQHFTASLWESLTSGFRFVGVPLFANLILLPLAVGVLVLIEKAEQATHLVHAPTH
jgi:uncharacterized membrane protein